MYFNATDNFLKGYLLVKVRGLKQSVIKLNDEVISFQISQYLENENGIKFMKKHNFSAVLFNPFRNFPFLQCLRQVNFNIAVLIFYHSLGCIYFSALY